MLPLFLLQEEEKKGLWRPQHGLYSPQCGVHDFSRYRQVSSIHSVALHRVYIQIENVSVYRSNQGEVVLKGGP